MGKGVAMTANSNESTHDFGQDGRCQRCHLTREYSRTQPCRQAGELTLIKIKLMQLRRTERSVA